MRTGTTPPAVDVEGVTVRFGRGVEALTGVDLRLEPGVVHGLLGRNGAGKSTLLSVVAGFRRPSRGAVRVAGRDPFDDPVSTGAVCLVREGGDLPRSDKVRDVLRLVAGLRPTWDHRYAEHLLERFELPRSRTLEKLSRGQRSALGVVVGLASRAPLTMFDEVHLGMDAPTRLAFYEELVTDYARRPRTVVLSTHLVDEAERLLERVVLLERGTVRFDGPVEGLLATAVTVTGPADDVDRFTGGRRVLATRTLGPTREVVVATAAGDGTRAAATAAGLDCSTVPLQDLVVHLTARSDRERMTAYAGEPA